MAKYRKRPVKRRYNSANQTNWKLIASVIFGAIIVLGGVGLVVGITVSNAGTNGPNNCPTGSFWCSIEQRCVTVGDGSTCGG
ncbi:MAG: hypothetical protein FWE01_02820 [Firmicutes bacterium]|nr:hypothetical protein [Bacillota bacterium]